MPAPMLVAVGRGWTPEEAARHEAALFRALASDKKALRVYLQKVRIVEMVRRQQVNPSPCPSATKDLDIGAAAGPDRRTSGAVRPTDAAAEPRVRRRKSEAQRSKSVQKLRRKKLQARCEAAATKAGGSPPKILARVLACCGRFMELLHPEGAERMERLRQAEALSKSKVDAMDTDKGLGVMRAALAATEAAASMLPIAEKKKADGQRLPSRCGQPSSPVAVQGGGKGGKGTKSLGLAVTRVVSPGAGANDWPKVGESVQACAPSHGGPQSSKCRSTWG